jgi:hypothetical protein
MRLSGATSLKRVMKTSSTRVVPIIVSAVQLNDDGRALLILQCIDYLGNERAGLELDLPTVCVSIRFSANGQARSGDPEAGQFLGLD